MKILLINYEFPPLGGGAGRATKNIARELADLGHEIIILTSAYKNLPKKESIDGYQIIRIKALRKIEWQGRPLEMIFFVVFAIIYVPKLFSHWRPDKVIAFFSIPSGIIAYWIKKKYKINYLISLRGGDVPGLQVKNLKFYHWLTLPLNKKIWQQATALIANSYRLQNLAQKTANKIGRQVKMIPNGVDINFFKPGLKKQNDKFKILFVGRLAVSKGIEVLIKVIGQLIKNDKSFRDKIYCEIIGRGPLEKKLKKLSKEQGLAGVVNFLGWLSQEALLTKYQQADIFVFLSHDEGMSNVILEAMACSLPIIASDIPSNRELIEDGVNGILIKEEQGIVEAISGLMVNPELRRQLAKASLNKISQYSWRQTAKQYLSILKD